MTERSLSVQRYVAAPPDRVYEAVIDLGRMASWSDEVPDLRGLQRRSEVVESWDDLRGTGPVGSLTRWLGTDFTDTTPEVGAQRNKAGIKITLHRLAAELDDFTKPQLQEL